VEPDSVSVDVDYADDGEGEGPSDYPSLQHKIEKQSEVTRLGLEQYENPAVMWTGGKDSTLTLYFINQVAETVRLREADRRLHRPLPALRRHHRLRRALGRRWDIDLVYARNDDVGAYVEEHGLEPGDDIPISALNEQNQHHVRDILEYEEDTFPFLLDTYVRNHLLKTVALNNALEEYDIDGVISGVRWDEQEARADARRSSRRDTTPTCSRRTTVSSPSCSSPSARRVGRVLAVRRARQRRAFPDEGVRAAVRRRPSRGVEQEDVPISPKYFAGFRSLGSEVSTEKTTEEPAWLRDLEDTTERAGRAQGQRGPDGAAARPRLHVGEIGPAAVPVR